MKLKSIIQRVLKSIIFIIVSTWVLLAILIYFFQPKLIFFPHSGIEATPELISLQYEDITLTTTDSEVLNAWWIPHPEARGTLLFLHGNAGNISHRLDSIDIFHQLGLSVLIIDYRGYGNSTGEPSEQGTYLDAETAWNYLINEKNVESDHIIIFGRSLGGAVATWLAEKNPPAGLIVESSFTSVADMGKHYYPYLPTSLLARIKYSSIDRIANIKSPTLFIHSKHDEVIPYKYGKQLFTEALKETTTTKSFLDTTGGHNNGFLISGKQYIDGLNRFITDIVQQ
ncbi:MAG: fermentation-respiration switch protein FrsA (DUF1100 family) [Gammaproteobacteria bacterium]|jgi:fermentation-respiration switch protein FrsA (DUF1100 family)